MPRISKGVSSVTFETMIIMCDFFSPIVPGDKSALNPSGIRLGTPALTTRGLLEADIQRVVQFISKGLQLALEVSAISGPKLVDFKRVLVEDSNINAKVTELRTEVESFTLDFPMPGYEF